MNESERMQKKKVEKKDEAVDDRSDGNGGREKGGSHTERQSTAQVDPIEAVIG